MPAKTTWETFFDAHAPVYDENIYTKNTLAEVDFLIEELGLTPGAAILDVGCGTGRHAVELARRGYAVTGVDLSTEMLARAASAAKAAGVDVTWVRDDATKFSLPKTFDAAICLCEGSFGLLGQGDDPIEQPLTILSNISRCLKPGAKALLTVLSATRLIRMHQDADVVEGLFDPLSIVVTRTFPPREGMDPLPIRERGFVGTELRLLCRAAGLTVEHMWGGTAGNWGRRPLELDEFEIMLVARKTGEPSAPS
jgi:ubiquinone/menaquinone biosynthesis C-methylase UbiE